MKDAMSQCSHYYTCSAPICPLDPEMEKRLYLEGEAVCDMEKQVRMKLGKDLPNRGLFAREIAARARWDSKTEEEKEAIKKRCREQAENINKRKRQENQL